MGDSTPPIVLTPPWAGWLQQSIDDGRASAVRERAARPPRCVDVPAWVPPRVVGCLADRGISRLWAHQGEAASALHAGRHTIVTTGTASGKTLAFQLPVVSDLVTDQERGEIGRAGWALYVAPTKALAADQHTQAQAWWGPLGLRTAVYDGDTPQDEREWIRRHGDIVLTNPDMLHHSLLPSRRAWGLRWRRLRWVVVDECHLYRGVFGAHVAAVLRRLLRLAAGHGAHPTVACLSATVADPAAHAARLTGLSYGVVDVDASPAPASTTVVWRRAAPDDDATEAPHRPGAAPPSEGAGVEAPRLLTATGSVLADLVASGAQTLAFARSRVAVEIVADVARRRLDPHPAPSDAPAPAAGPTAGVVAAYRGGYLPEERRDIEQGMRSGTVRGVAATSALESGIDIHGLDAVVVGGWPGTHAAFRQQSGRAGRADRPALTVFVPGDDPLDAYLARHPDDIWGRVLEVPVLDPYNPHVLAPHLAAAAQECPLTDDDVRWFGAEMPRLAEVLCERGLLRRRPTGCR